MALSWFLLLSVLLLSSSAYGSNFFDAKLYGAIPNDIAAAQTNTAAFLAAAKAADAIPGAIVTVSGPPAVYFVGKTILLDGITDIVIDLAGSSVVGTEQTIFVFERCTNLVIRGFAVDWATWNHVGGQVLGVDTNLKIFDVRLSSPFLAYMAVGRSTSAYVSYNPVTRNIPAADGSSITAELHYGTTAPITAPYHHDPNVIRVTSWTSSLPKVGEFVLIQMSIYGSGAFEARHSQNIRFEHLTVHHTPGMAFSSWDCGDLTFHDANIKRSQGRWMSTAADGIHIAAPWRGSKILFENSHMDGMGDDGFNVFHLTTRVKAVFQPQNAIQIAPFVNVVPPFYKAGDIIELSIEGQQQSPYARLTVVRSEWSPDPFNMIVYVSEKLPQTVGVGHYVTASSEIQVTIRNNQIISSRSRGIVIAARGTVIIENNLLQGQFFDGIAIQNHRFLERQGPPSRNIIIRGNHIDNPRQYGIHVVSRTDAWHHYDRAQIHNGIQIIDNRITNVFHSALWIGSAGNVVLARNTIENVGDRYLVTCYTRNVNISNNKLKNVRHRSPFNDRRCRKK